MKNRFFSSSFGVCFSFLLTVDPSTSFAQTTEPAISHESTSISASGATTSSPKVIKLYPVGFFAYRKLITSSIKSHWTEAGANKNRQATVQFDISPQGVLSSVTIVKSSGDDQFDRSLLDAIVDASPLPPPPVTVIKYFESVRAEFDDRSN